MFSLRLLSWSHVLWMGLVGREYGMRALGMGGWLQNQGGRGPGQGEGRGQKWGNWCVMESAGREIGTRGRGLLFQQSTNRPISPLLTLQSQIFSPQERYLTLKMLSLQYNSVGKRKRDINNIFRPPASLLRSCHKKRSPAVDKKDKECLSFIAK